MAGLSLLLLLSSCATSSEDYVGAFSGYWVTRGSLAKVENLNADGRALLSDGMATMISAPGCQVTMVLGDRAEVLSPSPGSILLFGQNDDYLLQPYQANTGPGEPKRGEKAPGHNPGTQGRAPDSTPVLDEDQHGDHLLQLAADALEFIDAGSIDEALKTIDGLSLSYPDNPCADLFQSFLYRRLDRLLHSPRESDPTFVRRPSEATKAFEEAKAFLKKDRLEDARQALERAYWLDPENEEIANSLVSLLKKIGLSHYSNGESSKALGYWKRVTDIRPDDVEARRFRERAEALKKKKE